MTDDLNDNQVAEHFVYHFGKINCLDLRIDSISDFTESIVTTKK